MQMFGSFLERYIPGASPKKWSYLTQHNIHIYNKGRLVYYKNAHLATGAGCGSK